MPLPLSMQPTSSASSGRSAEIEPGAKSQPPRTEEALPCSKSVSRVGRWPLAQPLLGGGDQGEKSILHSKSPGPPPLKCVGSVTYEPDRAPPSREFFLLVAGGRTRLTGGQQGASRHHLRAGAPKPNTARRDSMHLRIADSGAFGSLTRSSAGLWSVDVTSAPDPTTPGDEECEPKVGSKSACSNCSSATRPSLRGFCAAAALDAADIERLFEPLG
jgi:hypothetical protein